MHMNMRCREWVFWTTRTNAPTTSLSLSLSFPLTVIMQTARKEGGGGGMDLNHIINKRHKGRQMSSLYFWLILHSISAVAEELF